MTLQDDVLKEYVGLSLSEWKAKIMMRGVDTKYDYRLKEAIASYERKIPILRGQLLEVAAAKAVPELYPDYPVEGGATVLAKINRLKEKMAVCLKEQQLRKDGLVIRAPHDTVYYIDLSAGNDANDGLATGTAWLTIEQYTTTTVRSAGDIAWVRANTSEIPAGIINFDEDGNDGSRIEIRGCSSTAGEDPWSDASDVKPIINFNSTTNYLGLGTDDYWRLYRLDVKNSTYSNGAVYVAGDLLGTRVEACDIHDNGSYGLYISLGYYIEVVDCTLHSNGTGNLRVNTIGVIAVSGSVFNSGSGTADGIVLHNGVIFLTDCTFGVTTQHTTASILWTAGDRGGRVAARNCLFSDTTEVSGLEGQARRAGSWFVSEDHDQVAGASKAVYFEGTIERDSAVQLDGIDSAKMTPNSSCDLYTPLMLSYDNVINGDYQIWCPASATTITITARETAAWAADPTSSQFYFEASYLDGVSGQSRSTVASSQSLSGITEVDFTMTFTPAAAGWVYVTCYLKKFESGKYIQASIAPAVS